MTTKEKAERIRPRSASRHDEIDSKPTSPIAPHEVNAAVMYLCIADLVTGTFPEAGTAAWIRLDRDDPAWLAGLAAAALQQVLERDIRQNTVIEASRAVSASAMVVYGKIWGEIARDILQGRGAAYIPRAS